MEIRGLVLLIAAAISVTAREYTEEELSRFPKYYYLDEYDRCLVRKDGLYCLGSFDLTPAVQPHSTYELLKEYSDETDRHFNRTQIHRGFCVSSRCPHGPASNASQRFEECATKWARKYKLRASINKLHYCHTYADRHAEQPMTLAQQLFLECFCAILVLNIVGTLYDMYAGENTEKNPLIMAFSIPANWRRVTCVYKGEDHRLAALQPLNGMKIFGTFGTTFVHTVFMHFLTYVSNVEHLEKLPQRIDGVVTFAGTSLMHTLVTMSCFFNAYYLLIESEKRPLNLFMLPLCIIKRYIRMAPLSLLFVGFAATWWNHFVCDGPLIPITVAPETAACQNKFWSHVFFYNNIVDRDQFCVLPSWYLAMDMHIYIVAATFTLIMWRHRRAAIKLYSSLFVASCILIGIMAHIKEFRPLAFMSKPESVRNCFQDTRSFSDFYISSWSALPACFLGLLLAHIQYEIADKRIKLSEYKWFVYLHYCASTLYVLYPLTGYLGDVNKSQLFYSLFSLFDRPFHCILGCIAALGLIHVHDSLRRFCAWSGWSQLTNISLAVVMLHWFVLKAIATRPYAFNTSFFVMFVDWSATLLITGLLAVPITVLVEIPWFVYLHYCASTLYVLYPLTGYLGDANKSQLFYSLFSLFDRPFHCILGCIAALGLIHVHDEELSSLPTLFDLDDYDRCLTKKDGLYCLGIFDLTSDMQPNPTYELLKTYSDESYEHFNRTRIHRGYCVSSRCPQEPVRNASQRFEHCVNEWSGTRTLRATLNTLYYCHTRADKYAERSTTAGEHLFLQCVLTILAINIIATVYDVYVGDKHKKNKLITAFSIQESWQSFKAVRKNVNIEYGDFSPLNGFRATSMLLTMFLHATIFHYAFFIINPQYLEKLVVQVSSTYIFGGTSLMQILITMSCFFAAYNLLSCSRKQELSLRMLPKYVIKRVIRIVPVSMLIVGFAATWWVHTRGGALAPITLGAESRNCQAKFWSQAFFVNTIVQPSEYCVTPSWFLAVNMHMYIVACALTLITWRYRRAALKLYPALFLASCILVAVTAYIKEYKSMIYITTPENIRTTFRESKSFTEFYISSWGALPSCFLGIILAHIQFEVEDKKIKLSDKKWFAYLHYCMLLGFVLWPLTGLYALKQSSNIFYATYILLDRPLHCIFACTTMLGLAHVDSPMRRFYSWSGWTILSRLSLTVMLLHWCVNMAIAARPVAYGTSGLDMIVDWLSTCAITYTLAVPIVLLVEIPAQKFLHQLLF